MDKSLTPQAIKKLKSMTQNDKVHLLARLVIMRQNSQISGMLARSVGTYSLGYKKAEIVHQLYDGNGRDKQRFNHMLNVLSTKNPYDYFDTYTLCAYAVYFDKFLKYLSKMDTIKGAYEEAEYETSAFVDTNSLFIDCPHTTFGSLTSRDNRKQVVAYLFKDLKIYDIKTALEKYLKGEKIEQSSHKYQKLSKHQANINVYSAGKVYANQVESYKDENGNTYFLDAEGNLIDKDEIQDFHFENITLHATKKGIKCYQDYDKEM